MSLVLFYSTAMRLTVTDNLLDRRLHGITIVGLTLGVLGALYLAYEFLGRRRGILRWLLKVITLVLFMASIWLILAFAFFFFAFIFWIVSLSSSLALPIMTFFNLGAFFVFVAAIFGMVGLLSGLCSEDQTTEQTIEVNSPSISFDSNFSIQDCLKGFFGSIVYWFLILVFFFALDESLFINILIICTLYGIAGAAAGGYWKHANQVLPRRIDTSSIASIISEQSELIENIQKWIWTPIYDLVVVLRSDARNKLFLIVRQILKIQTAYISLPNTILQAEMETKSVFTVAFWIGLWSGLFVITHHSRKGIGKSGNSWHTEEHERRHAHSDRAHR